MPTAQRLEAHCATSLSGSIEVPGDKSISHRAAIFGGLASGITSVSGFLNAADTIATCEAMRSLGAVIEQREEGLLHIEGVGARGLMAPAGDLDMGNSGTAMRLLCGALAGQRFNSVLIGDESLSMRPMGRIVKPLALMGAKIETTNGCPPMKLHGVGTLTAISYQSPIASAQVKSAVLLAGLYSKGLTYVSEPQASRDHTERMLPQFGCPVVHRNGQVGVEGGSRLTGTDVVVPGDPSSASFPLVAAALIPGSEVKVTNVGLNPLRTGLFTVLESMGARILRENERIECGEPVADLRVSTAPLVGVEVDPALVPSMIDEFPLLFVAAACGTGRTVISEAQELRVKESDRIDVMTKALNLMGASVEETQDGAVITGGVLQGGVTVDARGDHRCAMALAVAASVCQNPVQIAGCEHIGTSYPGFVDQMNALGMRLRPLS